MSSEFSDNGKALAEMDCTEIKAVASDFIDGDLGELDSDKVKSHLHHCECCSQMVGEIRHIVAVAATLRYSAEVPQSLRAKLWETIKQSQDSSQAQ